MSDSESDIELTSALPKKHVKLQSSPSDVIKNNNSKKITTKMMIIDALTELKSRKGVSLYAIKKYLTEKYQVNTEKLNFIIKKTLKVGVEDGTFTQLKGIGASGSFKLANMKVKVKKPKKEKETKKEPEKQIQKDVKKNKKRKVEKTTMEKPVEKKPKMAKKLEENKPIKKKIEVKATKMQKEKETKEEKPKKSKTEKMKAAKTPAKKKTIVMRRKSIGSIIKPPKMKPKNK